MGILKQYAVEVSVLKRLKLVIYSIIGACAVVAFLGWPIGVSLYLKYEKDVRTVYAIVVCLASYSVLFGAVSIHKGLMASFLSNSINKENVNEKEKTE